MFVLSNSGFKTSVLRCFFVLALGVMASANGSIVIEGTRVIYPAEKSEVSVRMTNQGDGAKLVQVWIDDGDRQASPENIKVPFVVLTPIFRIDPNKGQVTRIQYTASKDLPKDRESVFWLNVLEIPPKPSAKEQGENYLQFRYRTRIKLFFRPDGIEDADEAIDKLTFKYKPGYVQLDNPTPFYLSISSVEVGKDGEGGTLESQLIEPFSNKLFALSGPAKALQTPVIKFRAINDFGGAPDRETSAVAF